MHVFELDPTAEEYLPGTQSVQVDAPVASLQVPAAHSVQSDSWVLLAVVPYRPAPQYVHEDEPCASENRPGSQSAQSEASMDPASLVVPAGQG